MAEPDEDWGTGLLEQIFELWVEPELQRRGVDLDRAAVRKALVVMAPGRPVETLINDEAELVANVRATRAIEAGEEVTLDDFDEVRNVRPHAIDPDAGWIGFVRLGDKAYIAFDCRRNRARARCLLERANEFACVARSAAQAGHSAAAVENAYAAAELAVTAELLTIDDDPTKDHQARRRWFAGWTRLGNAPPDHGRALAALAKRRAAARYGEGSVKIRKPYLDQLVTTVEAMIAHAGARVADMDDNAA